MTKPEEKRIIPDEEDDKHCIAHRCAMFTTPPWDACDVKCPGDFKEGSDTWLKMIDDPKYESKCWECPVLKEMYPNVRKCDYFEKKYGK